MFAPGPNDADTIFALATGSVPSAIAVLRISGPRAGELVRAMAPGSLKPRELRLAAIRHPDKDEVLDRGFVVWFPGPQTYTGEDYLELHVHGGRAVISAFVEALGSSGRARPAEPGEFSRRAFLNGKMDLGALEGLSDLLASQTEEQRRQSIAHASGFLSAKVGHWRAILLELLARAEAALDFPDEADAPGCLDERFFDRLGQLRGDLSAALEDGARGEIIRDGFRVAIVGAPNAGKSSLLNAIAQRPAAIVTEIPGTTRDVIEVLVDLGGFLVRFFDTAGVRPTSDPVETEGIRRTREVAESANLILDLRTLGIESAPVQSSVKRISVWTKSDLFPVVVRDTDFAISAVTGAGLAGLIAAVQLCAETFSNPVEPAIIVRNRHRRCLDEALRALDICSAEPEICAENLRRCARSLDSLVGRVDTEEVLGEIFSRFCIGK